MAEIGARLREARMRAKIDINEVEVRTKIRAKYLRAIENEEWDLLPGEVYAKSFLRTYGDYLGLDTRQLLDDFKRRYASPSDHELRPIAPLGRDRDRDRRPRGQRIPPWVVIAFVLVLVVVALALIGFSGGKNPSTSTTTQTKAPKHHRARHPRPVLRLTAKTLTLQLIPTGQIYVCLVNGTGKTLIPGLIFAQGQTIPIKTGPKFLLTLGNNSVQMKVDGKTVPIPASSGSIGYELVPGLTKVLPVAKQPRCA